MLRGSKVRISEKYGLEFMRGREGFVIGRCEGATSYISVLFILRVQDRCITIQEFLERDLELVEPPVEV